MHVSSEALTGWGSGTTENPVTLQEALLGIPVAAPETILVTSGDYWIDAQFAPSVSNVIVQGESVDGVRINITRNPEKGDSLQFNTMGANVTWVNCQFYSNDPIRETDASGSGPAGDLLRGSFVISGDDNHFHSCVWHNLRLISWFSSADGGEWRGCLSFNHGWAGPDRNHGPGLYTQNKHSSNVKSLYASASLNHYWTGVQAYGSSNAEISNYLFQDFVTAGTRHLIGGEGGGSQNIVCTRVHTPNTSLQLGYNQNLNHDVTITDCINNVLAINNWETVTQSGNQLVSELTTNVVSVVDNQGYGEHLALVIAWNPEDEASVNADLAALNLTAGDLQFRSLQDYFGDRRNVSYDPNVSTVVSLAMSGTVSTPIGEEAPLYDNLFPLFGAWFVVRIQ